MTDLSHYEQFDTEFFSVNDTMGVPHPFTVGTKHVVHAADHCGGRLGKETMKLIPCAMKGCQLSYEEHETVLAINCKIKDNELLRTYLLTLTEQAEKDKYAGFVLVDCTK